MRDVVRERLKDIEREGLLRTMVHTTDRSRWPLISVGGRELLDMSSNDYLGLAVRLDDPPEHHRVGGGSGGSRLVSGSTEGHLRLEEELARFMGTEDAVLCNSGYHANVGAIPALTRPGDHILSDELNHASIIDGVRLSSAQRTVYTHGDVHAARLGLGGEGLSLVVTDSLFSMEGDEAPLVALKDMVDSTGSSISVGAGLYVDDAHGFGVAGPGGRGIPADSGVVPDVLMSTFSKALGCFGAFIAADSQVCSLIRNRSRSFIFSTALPPDLVETVRSRLRVLPGMDDERSRVARLAERLRGGLSSMGFVVPGSRHIVPVVIGGNERTMDLASALQDEGLFVRGIRSPTVPPGTERIRLTVSALHTDEMIDATLTGMERVGRDMGVI